MSLRHTLIETTDFATVVELVPWAGELDDARGERPLKMAVDLAGDPRITALSITDNAGGHARLSPGTPAQPVVALGHDVIVHVACRDRNRNALQSLGWDLLSRGLSPSSRSAATTRSRGTRACPSRCSTSTRSGCWGCSGSWARRWSHARRPRASLIGSALVLPGLRDLERQALRAGGHPAVPEAGAQGPQRGRLRDQPGGL